MPGAAQPAACRDASPLSWVCGQSLARADAQSAPAGPVVGVDSILIAPDRRHEEKGPSRKESGVRCLRALQGMRGWVQGLGAEGDGGSDGQGPGPL